MSDKTIKRAIRGLKDKQLINSKRVKLNKNVVNMWYINWELIDKVSEKFKFQEVDCTEEKEKTANKVVMEVKTPCIQTETKPNEECPTIHTERVDNPTNKGEENRSPIGLDSDEFYTKFISGNILYWIHLYSNNKMDELKYHLEAQADYASKLFYNGDYKDECYGRFIECLSEKSVS